jgi:exopolyphosphatase/guanosine-5'-triphosphate,3'-diphosphate pyrophosphatase
VSICAAIDIGTNSMKLFVGDTHAPASSSTGSPTNFPVLEDLAITRLGEGLAATGLLTQAAISRNVEQLERFVARARAAGAVDFVVAGTMALREARNAQEFVRAARERCGVEVEILPGEEEARLSFVGVLTGLETLDETACVFDIGGGSTEFILGDASAIASRISINLGVRRPSEEHLRSDPPTPSQLEELRASVRESLAQLPTLLSSAESIPRLLGMGGTITTLAAVQRGMKSFDPKEIRNTVVTKEEVERQIALYARLPLKVRQGIEGLAPDRADVILAGACIVAEVFELLQLPSLKVSERGLRHGLFHDRFLPPPASGH